MPKFPECHHDASAALLLLVYWRPFFILSSSQLNPLLRKLSWPHSLEKTCLYAHNLLKFFCFSLSPLFLTQLLGQGSFPAPYFSSTILPFFLFLSASGVQEIPLIRTCPNPSFLKTLEYLTYMAEEQSQIHGANQPPSQCAAN